MGDAESDTILVPIKSVILEVDEAFSEAGEKELHGSGTIKANNDAGINELVAPDTRMTKLSRPSLRNKIPASRSSDFLW
jgi:hypothetical protein